MKCMTQKTHQNFKKKLISNLISNFTKSLKNLRHKRKVSAQMIK